jgi:cytochrome c-L
LFEDEPSIKPSESRAPFRKKFAWLLLAVVFWVSGPSLADPAFTSAIDDSPLAIKLLPNEVVTDAVKKFYETGDNPYKDHPAGLQAGKAIYLEWCQACHLPDGSGRIGPSFLRETHHYKRFVTDKGMFEIIYGGATGAMQGFGNRLTQDQVLQVMAYVRSLKK